MSTLRVSTPTGQVTLRDDRTYIVGRGRDSDVVVADSRVSRNHVRLEPGAREWVARDISANGMWSEGKKVSAVTVGGSGSSVRLRLGAADGLEVVMAVERPAAPLPSDSTADMDEAATMLAPGSRSFPPPPAPRAPAGHAAPAGRPAYTAGHAARPVAPPAAPVDAAAGRAGSPSAAMHWLRVIPTLLWLAATGFTLGALIALS